MIAKQGGRGWLGTLGGAAVVLIGALSAWLCAPSAACACATCSAGDPTLTVMGAQQPYEQRLRVSLEVSARTDAVGQAGIDRVTLNEQRTTLGLAYAPSDWLMLSASLPLLRREVTQPSLAVDTMVNLGDTELRARAFVWREPAIWPDHLLSVIAGASVPTAPLQRESGRYLEPELQPGTGSFDPLGGLSYAFFADPWSLYASEVLYVPTQGISDARPGISLRGTHAVQYQLTWEVGLRLGANFRWEAAGSRDGEHEPDSGGFILFGMPSVVWSPVMDLVLDLSAQIPVVNALEGTHDEGAIFALGAAYDL